MPQFQPPPHLHFNKPSEWPRWRETFLRYRRCSKLDKEQEEIQIDSLIYSMGPKAEGLFKQLSMTEAESTSFETVLDKFDHYFKPHTNVISEREKLNQRTQQQGETVEQSISSIYE